MATTHPTTISRRFVEEVWGNGDRDVAREIVAPDVVHHRRRRGEALGIEGLFEGLAMYDQGYPNRRFTQDDVAVDGALVADRWTMTAVHEGELFGIAPTHRSITLTGMNRYRIKDGRIVEVWHDEDIQGMVDQLGGLPAPTDPGTGAPAGGWPPASAGRYSLRGPQVEPESAFWTIAPCPLPQVVRVSDLIQRTDDPQHPWFFRPYPDAEETRQEIEELLELASLRDDPANLAGGSGNLRRLAISPFLQLRPQPLGAVYDLDRDAGEPVIKTGRELARWFENETPGLGHRHALNYLIPGMGWAPARQTRVWAALDIAIHSAILAAWHYKWFTDRVADPDRVAYRPRPAEVDYRVSVMFNAPAGPRGAGTAPPRSAPLPSPGSPRHPSYPSGHSTVGGAASEVLSYFLPDFTGEFDMMADNCGVARLWGGIHYRSDHQAGQALGRAVGRMVIEQLEAGCASRDVTPYAAPPSQQHLRERAAALRACCEQRAR